MPKKAKGLTKPSEPKDEDKVINDLIERRKLQQEALTKIMSSMDAMIEQLNYSTAQLLDKNISRRLPK